MRDVPFLNIVDPEFDFGAPEVMSAQQENWYAHGPGSLVVLRYEQAQELLRDPRLQLDGRTFLAANGIVDGPIHDWFVPMISNRHGEDHRRLRRLVNRAFTPRTVDRLRPFIRAAADRLVDDIASVEVCEFVADFGDPLPLAVMCELLGVPAQDVGTFRAWTLDIGLVFSLAYGGDIPERVERAVVGLNGYVDALMAAKDAAPADDLISALVTEQRAGGEVSTDELRNLIVTLVFAAHDTTRFQLAKAMVTFADHHDQWALLARRAELIPRAVEEVMRWSPTANVVFRSATQDFDYHGLRVAKGTFVVICAAAAQRDPRAFGSADTGGFDITADRTAAVLLFGGGPHHCLGAALARAELAEALGALTSRLGPPSVAGPFTWRPPIGFHGPNTLPLRFATRSVPEPGVVGAART